LLFPIQRLRGFVVVGLGTSQKKAGRSLRLESSNAEVQANLINAFDYRDFKDLVTLQSSQVGCTMLEHYCTKIVPVP
jgi:hypothetical protein